MKKTVLSLMVVVGLATLVAACGGGGGGGHSGGGYYAPAWYNVYGNVCSYSGPAPGCNFYSDGTKIRDWQDPYYYNHSLRFDTWIYTDSYGTDRVYTGYAWWSNSPGSGILYDSSGYALNQDNDGESRDMMANFAELETAKVKEAAKAFSDQYALAEDTGLMVAQTLHDWAVLGKSRERTAADVAAVSKRLYGVDMDRASKALEKAQTGDLKALSQVNDDVAAHWGTNPETSKEILMNWYSRELNQIGL